MAAEKVLVLNATGKVGRNVCRARQSQLGHAGVFAPIVFERHPPHVPLFRGATWPARHAASLQTRGARCLVS